MSYETDVHGEIEVTTGPTRVTIVNAENYEEPSLRLTIGDKTAITKEDKGHISLRLAIEDENGNVGTARASFGPDKAREVGEALVEEADSDAEPLLGGGFAELEKAAEKADEIENDEADELVGDLESGE